jgi:hypothetical protein
VGHCPTAVAPEATPGVPTACLPLRFGPQSFLGGPSGVTARWCHDFPPVDIALLSDESIMARLAVVSIEPDQKQCFVPSSRRIESLLCEWRKDSALRRGPGNLR